MNIRWWLFMLTLVAFVVDFTYGGQHNYPHPRPAGNSSSNSSRQTPVSKPPISKPTATPAHTPSYTPQALTPTPAMRIAAASAGNKLVRPQTVSQEKPSERKSAAEPRARSESTRLTPAQQKNIQKLLEDLMLIKQGSKVTPQQKATLKSDLLAMADDVTKVDRDMVEDLANHLAKALSDGRLSKVEMAQLSADLQKVMNSANISKSEVTAALNDAKEVLEGSGVEKADAKLILTDMKALGGEIKVMSQTALARAKAEAAKAKAAAEKAGGKRRASQRLAAQNQE